MRTDPRGTSRRSVAAHLTDEQIRTVQRICSSRLSRCCDAEDAAQETFVQFLLADHDRIVNEDAWLITVAMRVCSQFYRRRYRMPETALTDSLPDLSSDPADQAVSELWLADIGARLRPADRTILVLRYVADRPVADVANELHVTESHARVLAFRARRRAAQVCRRSSPDLLQRQPAHTTNRLDATAS